MLHNFEILKAVDERQQRADGRPLWMSAHQLFTEITGGSPTSEQAPGFLQELRIANAAGLLTWQVSNLGGHEQDAYLYLQRIDQLALTVAGQDRARSQMVVLPPPDSTEDDGHQLSDLILRRVAKAITEEYAPDERVTFLGEQGIPPDWLALPEETAQGDVHVALAATWRAGSDGRRLVRNFVGRWIDDQLISGPDAELRATLIEQLARQGWRVRLTDSVLVVSEPVRGVPVSAGFLRASRLHAFIEAEARPQFLINKPEQGVVASMKAVEIRVRKLAAFGDDVIGTDLMNRAFGPTGPLTDKSAVKGEQEGTRSLFAGAMAVLRNPASHREVDHGDLSEAAEAVQVASLLMRILDRVDARLVAAGRAAQVT